MISDQLMSDAQTLWDYHQLGHMPRRTDIAIGLGSHDIGVAEHAADLYRQGMFPLIVFTGANAPTTVNVFPRGEAIHFAERARQMGVPKEAILTETRATNTGENISFTRQLLATRCVAINSATLISRPYQQRRSYATTLKLWPEIAINCSSQSQNLIDYLEKIGDADRVLNMLVGDTQRIWKYAQYGFAAAQSIDNNSLCAYHRLVACGYTDRLID